MVAWYRHDIPDWMDGTEGLDDGPYRVYHVVCQLIYLNEGPIALNEKGIAGRCNQHILAFRRHLATLIDLGKLALIDGRLSNNRAATELQYVDNHRAISAKGGRGSAGVPKGSRKGSGGDPDAVADRSQRDSASKTLENNDQPTAALSDTNCNLDKTRQEKTRQDDVVVRARGKSVFREADFNLTTRIMRAWGLHEADPRGAGTAYFANKWLTSGWQDDVIVSTIERIMAKRDTPPNNLRYFEQAIADAHAELARPVPVGSTGPPRRERRTAGDIFHELDAELKGQTDVNLTGSEQSTAGPGIVLDA